MQINKINTTQQFGRAFSTKEKEEYKKIIAKAKTKLDIKDTSAIIFDFNMPSTNGKNPAIGTTWSEAAKQFIPFLKDMAGISSVQLAPQGTITRGNKSPYSGSVFAYGSHIIDLDKLTTKEYGELLSPDYIKQIDEEYPKDKGLREYRTDYSYVLGTDDNKGIQKKALDKAYETFMQKVMKNDSSITKLNKEYKSFINKNKDWAEKEAIFSIFSQIYGTEDITRWSLTDRTLNTNKKSFVHEKRFKDIKENYKEEIDKELFIQFLADKEQKESRKFFNSQDVKIYGDCLLGFSPSEIWANIDCFKQGQFYGGPDPNCTQTNYIQTWGLNALDYTKLGSCDESGDTSQLDITGKLLFEKFKKFFERYDGVRVDAAWQFITPFIYEHKDNEYTQVPLPEIDMTIFNIINAAKKATKTNQKNNDNIMLELVGLSADRAKQMTLNKYPHLYTTAYAEYDEVPKKFLEKGYKRDYFYTGVGCHDNDSLVNLSRDKYKRELHLKGMQNNYNLDLNELEFANNQYQSQTQKAKAEEDFRNAKFGEIFSGSKQFFTLPDMFGMQERINISGQCNDDNWTIRIPSDYEKFYYSQLSKGYGLNLPKALAIALNMNGINSKLVDKCNRAAEILRSSGPLSEEEANTLERQGLLKERLT